MFESNQYKSENFSFLDFLPHFKFAFLAMAATILLYALWCFALSLKDFYRDTQLSLNRIYLAALILLPPWFAYLLLDRNLETFRSVVGILSSLLLASFIPIIWVWTLRYHLGTSVKPVLKGGKKLLVAMLIFAGFLVFVLLIYPQKIYW